MCAVQKSYSPLKSNVFCSELLYDFPDASPGLHRVIMTRPLKELFHTDIIHSYRQVLHSQQLILSLLALVVGALAALGAIAFRKVLSFVQAIGFGTGEETVYTFVEVMPFWQVILIPTLGGLIVGLACKVMLPNARAQNMADVIEAEAYRDGRMSFRNGVKAALISAFSLGTGTSLGREGPVVHLGASLGASMARLLHLRKGASRTLLGCGVASAVAASFNAPIAGALFAHEVVVGHYALSAFAPIVLASVTGTVVGRLFFGDIPAFLIPGFEIVSFLEFPAFVALGVLGAVTAVLVMRSVPIVVSTANKLQIPLWLRPACAGVVVGCVAVWWPQMIGVGYGAMDAALNELYDWWPLLQLLILKCFCVVVCLGLSCAGGVFSPSLFIGAMLGGVFGIFAAQALPHLASGHGAYTLVGMGTVASAMLGAPISTTLMLFELTGDYAITMAVLVSSVVASVVLDRGAGSFFDRQLAARGFAGKFGREIEPLRRIRVAHIMRMQFTTVVGTERLSAVREKLVDAPHGELFVVDGAGRLTGTITLHELAHAAFDSQQENMLTAADIARVKPPVLMRDDSLEKALKLMESSGEEHLAVIDTVQTSAIVGFVHEKDALMAYNTALMEYQAELHGADAPPKIF